MFQETVTAVSIWPPPAPPKLVIPKLAGGQLLVIRIFYLSFSSQVKRVLSNCPLTQKKRKGEGRRDGDRALEAEPGTDIGSETDPDTRSKDPGRSIKKQRSTRLRGENCIQTIVTRILKLTEEETGHIALTGTGEESAQGNTHLKILTVMDLTEDDPCLGMRKRL